jgi:hypothetical protein
MHLLLAKGAGFQRILYFHVTEELTTDILLWQLAFISKKSVHSQYCPILIANGPHRPFKVASTPTLEPTYSRPATIFSTVALNRVDTRRKALTL